MIDKSSAISKIEAWARWGLGSGGQDSSPFDNRGVEVRTSADFMPSDQADYLTVEAALKDFGGRRPALGLRNLLVHVYAMDGFPESFDTLSVLAGKPERELARALFQSYGIRLAEFNKTCLHRFVRFLANRLKEEVAA